MINDLLTAGHRVVDRVAEPAQSVLLLLIRLIWGWQFFQTGWGKLMNLDRTAGFFAELGIPFPELNAVLAGSAECFGGLFLLLGLLSRLAAIPLIFTMIIAYVTAEPEALRGLFTDPDPFFAAAPFQFLFASLLVLIFGPGQVSLDHFLGQLLHKKTTEPTSRPT